MLQCLFGISEGRLIAMILTATRLLSMNSSVCECVRHITSKLLSMALILLLGGLLPFSVEAQATHQVSLTWTLSVDDNTTNCTTGSLCSQNVYRTAGACTPTTVFAAPLANVSATATGYTDLAVSPGQTYCYAVTFVEGTLGESVFSNTVTAKVQPFPPTNLNSLPK
jgi:fibronectin type 3 domain-containing protein